MNTKIEEFEEEKEIDSTKDLNFKKLYLWTLEPLERMKWLACCCDLVSSKIEINKKFIY
jgi:hypothetical protein